MSKTTFIVNGVDVLEENKKLKEKYQEELTVNTQLRKWQDEDLRQIAELKKENEILQTSLEMIKNTEGQAHIKAIELTKKLEKTKEICKEAIKLCDCPDADVNYDCVDCTDGGRASLAKDIMEVLKDE